MGFLAPFFLLGLAGLAAPLYLHLLRRQTSNPRPVPSLMFFEARTQSSMRHRRLRYLWLLACRLALLALLAFAFANPYIWRPASKVASSHLTLYVVDHAFSMRAAASSNGGASRLAAARRQAESDAAGNAGRGMAAALGARLELLTPPGADPATLQSALAGIQPGDSRASLDELARGLRQVAETTPTPITVEFYSDLRQSMLPANFSDLALPANVQLRLHPIGAALPNFTVESVKAPTDVWGSPKTAKPARVEAVIAGYGTPAATKTVTLDVNGQSVASKTVSVPASGRATVTFDNLNPPYGWSRCTVRITPADGFPNDDQAVFAVHRADPAHILFIHAGGSDRSALYFSAALGAGADSPYIVDESSPADAATRQLAGYAFVVASDLPSVDTGLESSLDKYVRAGGGLLLATGAASPTTGAIPVLGLPIASANNYTQQFLAVTSSDPSDPSTAHLGTWPGVRFFYALRVAPNQARVVTSLSDGTPLLLDQRVGEGRVLLFTSGLDNLANDFPLHPAFVAFVQDTAHYLANDSGASGLATVDDFLTLRNSREQGSGVEVTAPDGSRPLSLGQAASANSLPLTQAGFYALRLADGREQLVGVNPDRRESDLAVMPAETIALIQGTPSVPPAADGSSTAQPASPQRVQVSFWWYIILLMLLAAVAESIVAARHLTPHTEPEKSL